MTIIEIILMIVVAALGSGGLVSFLRLNTVKGKDSAQADKASNEAQAVVIQTLQEENRRLSKEVDSLRMDVAELRGHLESMERLKVDQIAQATAKKVLAELVGDPDINLA